MACLDDPTIEAFARGALDADAHTRVERHLQECADCCTLVAEYAKWSLGEAEPDEGLLPDVAADEPGGSRPLAPGTRLGRYRIVRPIAAGGGGAVYEGFDPQLRRRVAIKVLHVAWGTEARQTARAQLVREAQTLARLAHPNVVSIHDAGVFEGEVFLVLEYVEGETLAAWLERGQRPWRTVLQMFLDAGRGLAAAHRAGVVHGDFKPENVLVGADGRARVADFGLALARVMGGRQPTPPAGTPRYMAPEQFAGQAPDERSDQFSFCVSLKNALTGAPARLQAELAKGVREAPDQRHPSLELLLAALERAARPLAWGRWVAAASSVMLVAIVLGGFAASRARRPASLCGDGRVQPGEECDDGNDVDGDGCTAGCLACGPNELFWDRTGHCYSRHDQPATFWEARDLCGTRGGSLVTFGHRSEFRAVESALLRQATAPVWLGLRQDVVGRGFVWITGESLDASLPGLPAEARGAGDLGCMVHAPDSRRTLPWRTEPCASRFPYLCERGPWIAHPRTGHRYLVLHDPRPWTEAAERCRQRGAHLATITDAEELAFVAAHVGSYAWLGADDREQEGNYRWTTGEPFAYRAFSGDQPNDANGSQDCLALGPDNLWHDWMCEAPYAYVCEIE